MKRSSLACLLTVLPGLATGEEPLSAIDWLKEPAPVNVAQPLIAPLDEPLEDAALPLGDPSDGETGAITPGVAVTPLGQTQADAVGLLPSATTGLPITLWQASSTDAILTRLNRLPDAPLPALQALIYTLLLAEAAQPADTEATTRFLKARIETLQR